MPATMKTRRQCPYCGTVVCLADCCIVATNFEGAGALAAGRPEEWEDVEIELRSGREPLRKLAKSGWPVLAEAPTFTPARPTGRSRRARVKALDGQRWTFWGGKLPPPAHNGNAPEDLPARACPSCEFPLPQDIDDRQAVVIAVVGVNRVGKTHFLAASMAEAYRNRGLAALGCTEFRPDDASSTRFMDRYLRPLFRERRLLAQTQQTGEALFQPLIFNLTLDATGPFSLVVHDIAGEVLGDQRTRAHAATFLRAAQGIIFIVDPRDIEGLRPALPAWVLDDHDDELGFDQAALLGACLGTAGPAVANGMVPVAITISKADLLPDCDGRPLPFLERTTPARETYDEMIARITARSDEVAAFLDRNGAHDLLAPARDYERRCAEVRQRAADPRTVGAVTYHAVSALGSTPTPDEEISGVVEPLNCVDPLAAVLTQVAARIA